MSRIVVLVANPLLSTYRAGENRVTSSTMAVLERIDLALVQELLEAASGAGGELRTVVFENQIAEKDSVPDARISARFTWWFETKTARGGYAAEGHDRDQLRSHSKKLETDADARLFVLTPDAVQPSWFDELDGIDAAVRDRVLWLSFRDLADAINRIIVDPVRIVGEQTKFLLSELVALYETDGLLTIDDTVVVAARAAWPEYQQVGAYICQPNRAFRDGLTHFGFYTRGEIQPLIPRIREHLPSVVFTREEAADRRVAGQHAVADLIERSLDGRGPAREEGDSFGIVLLSGPDDEDTVRLDRPVVNDTTSVSGKPWAWTLGQRYTRLERLRTASATSEL
jgi:hypothetical protein